MSIKPGSRAFYAVVFSVGALFVAGIFVFAAYDSAFGFQRRTGQSPEIASISNPTVASDEQNSIEVYKTRSSGVAFITTSAKFENYFGEEFERESGGGSGSVIDDQGHILTNYHVVEGASKLMVSFGGDKIFPATLVGADPDTDLAVIKITSPAGQLTVIPLGDSDKLDVGQKVLAIGNPFGLDRTLTTGVISGLQRPIRARNGRPIDAAIQTDASINPGNSGGPLLDKFGRMIGINSQILSPAGGSVGVGFAVPVNTAKRIIPQLIQFGEVRRPRLGAVLRSVEALNNRGAGLSIERGLLVLQTEPGGTARRAGIKSTTRSRDVISLGDIILSIDGEELREIDDLYRLMDKRKIGDRILVKIFRDAKVVELPMVLRQAPATRNRRS